MGEQRLSRALLTCFLASQVAAFLGSFLLVGGMVLAELFAGKERQHLWELFIGFLLYAGYSWVVVTPVCVVVAAPLKVVVSPRWSWWMQSVVCALVGGVLAIAGGVALGAMDNRGADNVLETSAFLFGMGAYYAGFAGAAEWLIARRVSVAGEADGEANY